MSDLDKLMDACTAQDHWLSFDINPLRGVYRIGNKPFRSIQKAANEVERLVKQRAEWAKPQRAA